MRLSKKHAEAFKDELNWVGSGLAIAACFFAGLPLAIPFAWAAYEAAYMLFVPDSKWYEQRLSRKADAEVEQRRRELKQRYLPALLEPDRRRFEELEQLRADIAGQLGVGGWGLGVGADGIDAAVSSGQNTNPQPLTPNPRLAGGWSIEILRKLDFLLERFLLFASKRAEYIGYLRELADKAAPPSNRGRRTLSRRAREQQLAAADADTLLQQILESYDRRTAEGEAELQREGDPQTADVLRKNLDVLARLRENTEQIGQIVRNLEGQLNLVADTFALINGQIRTSPPEQMLSDVDDVIGSSKTLTDTLAEIAPLEQAIQRLGSSSQTP